MSLELHTADLPASDPDHRVGFLLSLARSLHAYGTSTQQIEDALNDVATRLGIVAQFFITPTSVFAAFGPLVNQRTYLMRVEPGTADLGKLAALGEVIEAITREKLSPIEGIRRLAEITRTPSPYHPAITLLAFILSSAAACRFLGGGAKEVLVASILGLVTSGLATLAARLPSIAKLFTPLAAFSAALLATLATQLIGGYAFAIALLAGLIVLLPGMTLTTAMSELAANHLSAGTARLFGAFIIFIGLGVGTAFGRTILKPWVELPEVTPPIPLPPETIWLALIVAATSFAILLRAQPRDIPWIILSGTAGFLGSLAGGASLGAEFGVLLGAIAVGLGSNLYSHLLHRPAAVTEVPGILLLVPGSVGFRSITAMLDRQVLSGVDTMFQMLLLAISLVAGLLFANVVFPERRLG